MMATKTKLPMTNELVLALLAKKYASNPEMLAAVKKNPRKVLELHNDALQVKTVQNTAHVLHVCVPDYGALKTLEEQKLAQISAGTSMPASGTSGSGASGLQVEIDNLHTHTTPAGRPDSYIPIFAVAWN